jgi:hypothetical protein
MFCSESEAQLSEGDVPISQDAVLVVPETLEEDWPIAVEQEVAAVDGSSVAVVEPMLEQPVANEEHQAAMNMCTCFIFLALFSPDSSTVI